MQKRINLLALILFLGSSSLFAQSRTSVANTDFQRSTNLKATSLVANEIRTVDSNEEVYISSIYPNPTSRFVTLKGFTTNPCEDCLSITLYDGFTQSVLFEERTDFDEVIEQQFDLEEVREGTHFLTVQTVDGKYYTVLPLVVRK